MTRPVPDKAEVAIEYPDKFSVGTFEHSSRFEAHLESTGLSLTLERPGPEEARKPIHLHLNFGLLAAILHGMAFAEPRAPSWSRPVRRFVLRATLVLHVLYFVLRADALGHFPVSDLWNTVSAVGFSTVRSTSSTRARANAARARLSCLRNATADRGGSAATRAASTFELASGWSVVSLRTV